MKATSRGNKWKILVLTGVVVIFSFGFLAFQTNKEFQYTKSLDIFFTLFRELNLYYVDETNPEKLVKTAIDDMLESLDPYTTYIPESELDDFNLMTTGQYGGIGSLVRKSGDYAVISEIYKGFPADEAGVLPGDMIMEVDGKSIKGLPLEKVSDMLKGLPNTPVEVTFSRDGEEKPFKRNMNRKIIQIPSVPYYGMADNGIGYIRLSNFTQNAASDVKDAFLELKKDHALKGIVLDLRSNPGGLLLEAVDLSNIFVDKGQEIVSTRGKVKQWDNTYNARFSATDPDIPVAVLVNRSSASASEIVAGSLQDLDRAVIVGQRTFGKGLVQTTRPLSYNSRLKVTTAKYYIPSGRCIQALDYSHRNEDGSVGQIPDSLISAFQTKNGRTVYDGGGIRPDIEIEPESLSRITLNLYLQNLIFDYATLYRKQHQEIPPAADFHLSDQDYEQFKDFVNSRNFDYLSETEEALQELIEKAKEEKYYDSSADAIRLLKEHISHNKEKDLNTFRSEIQELLEEEIVSRYYYQEGRIVAGMDDDVQLKAALKVLNDPGEYTSLLHPAAVPATEVASAGL